MLEKDTLRLNLPKGTDELSDVYIQLTSRQSAFLDQLIHRVQEKTGHALQKPDVARALIDALVWSGADETVVAALYHGDTPPADAQQTLHALRDILVELLNG